MNNNDVIPIFFAINDKFSPFASTVIASIMENTHSYIDFHLMEDNISERNKRKLKKMEKIYSNCKISFLKIPDDYTNGFPNIEPYSLATYWRYFIPDLDKNLHKVIYSDVDMIYCGDIQEMYNESLDGLGLGAAPEEIGVPILGIYNNNLRKKILGVPSDHKWLQAGNLVIDCDYWRNNEITKRLKTITLLKKKDLLCPDMDVLNIVFNKKYKLLNYKYNVCSHRIDRMEMNEEVLKAEKNPFCIHYASKRKPWQANKVPYEDYFWYYATKSPFFFHIVFLYIKSVPMSYVNKIRFLFNILKFKFFPCKELVIIPKNIKYKRKDLLKSLFKFCM